MRAGELRHYGEVQQLSAGIWTDYATAYFAMEETGESDGKKTYTAMTWTTAKLTYIAGLHELDEGFSILVSLDGTQHRLVIDSALVAGKRREEIHFQCREFTE